MNLSCLAVIACDRCARKDRYEDGLGHANDFEVDAHNYFRSLGWQIGPDYVELCPAHAYKEQKNVPS